MKVRRSTRKWVLKQVARRYLPDHLVDRPKVGFRLPLDAWFRDELAELAHDMLLDPHSFVSSVLDRDAVRGLLSSHVSSRRDESIRIWTLLSLEVWHDVFFRSGSPARSS
jgi:asparagine synthase (glutamine-hydrolysing)